MTSTAALASWEPSTWERSSSGWWWRRWRQHPDQHRAGAGDDSGYSTKSGTQLTIPLSSLLANDRDANGDSLTITQVSGPTKGTAALDGKGNVVFTPTAGATGDGGFTYTVSDGKGGTDTGRVSLTVDGSSGRRRRR